MNDLEREAVEAAKAYAKEYPKNMFCTPSPALRVRAIGQALLDAERKVWWGEGWFVKSSRGESIELEADTHNASMIGLVIEALNLLEEKKCAGGS